MIAEQLTLMIYVTNWLPTFWNICDVLRDLVPFVQFRKLEKHPWRSVTFSNLQRY